MNWLTRKARPEEPGSDSGQIKSFSNGNCVEVAGLPGGGISVRDSEDSEGPVLAFTSDEWRAFLREVRNEVFERFTNLPHI